MADLNRDIRALVLHLAKEKAVSRSRTGVADVPFSKDVVLDAVKEDLVSIGRYDGEKRYFLSQEGIRRIESWVKEGEDDDGRPLTPEWLGRLRHLYG